jgi:hypothetical protein
LVRHVACERFEEIREAANRHAAHNPLAHGPQLQVEYVVLGEEHGRGASCGDAARVGGDSVFRNVTHRV